MDNCIFHDNSCMVNIQNFWKGLQMLYLKLINTVLHIRAYLITQLVKNPPAMWEIWVQFLGQEDELEKG